MQRPVRSHLRRCSRLAGLIGLAALFAACAPVQVDTPDVAKTLSVPLTLQANPLPQRRFAALARPLPSRSNADLARDFLELEFQLESGRALPVFTRFVEPVTVHVTGAVPATTTADLADLMTRLQSEAGLTLIPSGPDAAITIAFLPRRVLQANDPTVACFVAPGVNSWPAYQAARGTDTLDWAQLRRRDRLAIFIPSDVSPQEVRDCLHEELAQALGPLNDLFRLSDSVFNDDNFHNVLTGFDMLMLRVHYDPGLENGLTRAGVAARLPAILTRLNPRGDAVAAGQNPGSTPQSWVNSVEAALGPSGSPNARLRAARSALREAEAAGWTDGRLAFSQFAVGRVSLAQDGRAALQAFQRAAMIYRDLPGGRIQAAHVDLQVAALALSQGRSDEALALTDTAIPVVAQSENAALLATLMLIRAEALGMQGRFDEADAQRQDGLGWARYGFGSGREFAARVGAIAALVPAGFRG